MAWYKHTAYLKQSDWSEFDNEHGPGVAAPRAGIYRCMGCGREIGIAAGHTLPAQTHPQHNAGEGSIRWRLVVYADHRHHSEQK